MKRITAYLLIITAILASGLEARGQFVKKLIETGFADAPADTAGAQAPADSLRLGELERMLREKELELQQMRMNALAREAADSAKMEARLRQIDSLRAVTSGVPVVVDGDTLFTLYAARGGSSALSRAELTAEAITKMSKATSPGRDSVRLLDNETFVDIMYGDKVLMSVTDQDALWEGTTRTELAERYAQVLSAKLADMREGHSFMQILKRAALFVLVLVVQYLLFKLTNYLFRRLRRRIVHFKRQRLKPIVIRDYELLNTRQQGKMLLLLSNVLRYLVLLVQLTFSVPILFAIFPQTEKLALNIFLYIIEPIKMVLRSITDYVPNLFIIVVIWLCIKYIIKGIHYIACEIESEKLKISGFYPDWAQPTFNIVRFLLYAFMIAMIYPYLPGSESGVFQGISVFVGLIVSLGSSTVIGNIIAGLVITYMRPFKLGDRIKLNDTTGNVIEKTPFVTRIRTPKNEVVTIPNSFIMSSHTVNYSASARQFGLIIHTTVTIGYDAPWRLVHQLLINAARSTPGVLAHPKPFVLETELSDYYPCYQINAYIKDADNQAVIMSDLLKSIQDTFNEAGVEIMSPHYFARRDGSASTIPDDWYAGVTEETAVDEDVTD